MGKDFFLGIMTNNILLICVTAWMAAQILKVAFLLIVERRLDFSRLIESGGMPSSHSALVSSLFVLCGMRYGWNSIQFTITFILAMIVMYDATGVRQAAGKQAKILNLMMDEIFVQHEWNEVHLKELIGHTPFQVFVGAFLGILIAILLY
jgi:hypothetical protein